MAHPDEVVKPTEEVPSKLVAEAVLRHEAAKGDDATPQEKKQAAVEQAHALSTRPQGSYAQLHEVGTTDGTVNDGDNATLAVPDDSYKAELQKAQADDEKSAASEVKASQKSASSTSSSTSKNQ